MANGFVCRSCYFWSYRVSAVTSEDNAGFSNVAIFVDEIACILDSVWYCISSLVLSWKENILMAYLHCHNCGWSQDDFWELNGYNPFRQDLIEDLKECLFKDKIYLDFEFFEEANSGNGFLRYWEDEKGWFCTGIDYVAFQLNRKAKNISSMAVKTTEEWKKVKDTFVCPKCSKRNLDID